MTDSDYSDIINLPHHVSTRHRPMSMLARAAQFAPFAALTGHNDAISESGRLTENFEQLDENQKEKLDIKFKAILQHPNQNITVTYFKNDSRKNGGNYHTHNGVIKKIDDINRQIILVDGTIIPTDNIVDIALTEKANNNY